MKRSEINAALKEMENMVKEYRFAIPPFCNFTPEEWKVIMTKSGIICWDGILQIMAWVILIKLVFPLSQSAMET